MVSHSRGKQYDEQSPYKGFVNNSFKKYATKREGNRIKTS